ncbi:NUDIX hydrolase [Leucobacter sp. GX24907]
MASSKIIRVSAVVMRDAEGRVLNVRKRGTNMLMLPGGKPEPGEDAAATALREFSEELGVDLSPAELRPLGEFSAPAANEPGWLVVASVFEHPWVPAIAGVEPQAEIAVLEWVDPTVARDDMAPLNTEHVFPRLLSADDAGRITSDATDASDDAATPSQSR